MPEHPAMKRYRWKDKDADDDDPTKCDLEVTSNHSKGTKLVWIQPETGQRKPLADIAPGAVQSVNSFRDHAFAIRLKSKDSDVFYCRGRRSKYSFDKSLK